jgi:hypothetical protein
MTRKPSLRRLLANSKASRPVLFSALSVPVTPSTLMARITYCFPRRPLNERPRSVALRGNGFPPIGLPSRGDEFASQYPNWLWFRTARSDRGLFQIVDAAAGGENRRRRLVASRDSGDTCPMGVRTRGLDIAINSGRLPMLPRAPRRRPSSSAGMSLWPAGTCCGRRRSVPRRSQGRLGSICSARAAGSGN